ncbi:hypothetical protein [Aeoliella sp. SH292]|uniref:hypothetical protein n=1 Tax=Aeoliella sp. SH292 TaxID=3454464 RepID=UPI003F9E88E9
MIAVQMRVLELDEAKLRKVGIDYEIVDDRVKFSLMGGSWALPLSFPNLLVTEGLAEEVDRANLVFPADEQFKCGMGRQVPIYYYRSLMEKWVGTKVDITATTVDATHAHLAIDYGWTGIDRSNTPALPSFPTRRCQMTCDVTFGQRIVVPVDVTPTQGKQVRPTVMLILVEEHQSPIAGTSR